MSGNIRKPDNGLGSAPSGGARVKIRGCGIPSQLQPYIMMFNLYNVK
jgi:hypothetical protein